MNAIMRLLMFVSLALGSSLYSKPAIGQVPGEFREVSFDTADGGRVFANLYGDAEHGLVLAHGAVFDKESWASQSTKLAKEGFRVLAIDFRGYGKSQAGSKKDALYFDVLAAVQYLNENGVKRISVIGGSMGGGAAAQASVESRDGEIDDLILLAHTPISRPQKLKGRKLFIVSEGDGLVTTIRKQYSAASEPKRLVVLDGAAHAQHVFRSDQAAVLMKHIVSWLKNDQP